MQRRFVSYALALPATLLLLAAFIYPLILSVSTSLSGVEGGLLAHYLTLVTDPFYLRVIGRTLWFSFAVTLLCLALGFPTAYLIARLPQRWATPLLALAVFPLLVNAVVRSYAWMVVLGRTGLLNQLLTALGLIAEPKQYLYSQGAVIAGLTQLFLPLMILSIYSTLNQLDEGLEPAARGLGASPFTAFRRIVFPLALPGVLVGANLVFSACMTAFTTPQLLGGTRQHTLATLVYYYANVSMNWPLATALALVMFLLTFLVITAPGRFLRRRGWSS